MATLIAQGTAGCEQGDLIYSNFSVTGSTTDLTATISGIGTGTAILDLTDSVGFSGNVTLTYTVVLDPSVIPNDAANWRIVKASAGILQDDTGYATLLGSATATSGWGSGTETVTAAGKTTTASGSIPLGATAIDISDSLTYSSGYIINVSNIFTQQDISTPEPSTIVLMGGALIGLSAFARQRRSRSSRKR